jgi:Ca2+-binding RTX toxin-like protein
MAKSVYPTRNDWVLPAQTPGRFGSDPSRLLVLADAIRPASVNKGSDADDELDGSDHADILRGGMGNDRLSGAQGRDTFSWSARDLGGYQDVITDFSPGQDRLLFRVFDPKLSPTDCLAHFLLTQDDGNSVLQLKNHLGQVLQTVVFERTDLLQGQDSVQALVRLVEDGHLLLGHGRGPNMITAAASGAEPQDGKLQLGWNSQDLGGEPIGIKDFSADHTTLSLAVFDPSLSLARRLACLSLQQDGADSLLQLTDFHGKLLQVLRFPQQDLLRAAGGGYLSGPEVLQSLCRQGTLLLLDDEQAPAVKLGTLDRDSSFLSLVGGNGSDVLASTLGRFDHLLGGRGNDVLGGGVGNDTMTGKGGRDAFVWNGQDVGGYCDTITDFNPDQDVLRFQLFACQLSARQRLELLTLEQRGDDGVLLIRNHLGETVQTVVLKNTELLYGDQGELLTSAQALWLLNDRGALQLLNDEGAAALTQSVIEAESHFMPLRGGDNDDVLKVEPGSFESRAFWINGRGGDDYLEGAGGDDVLRPGGGNDSLSGRGGQDTFYWGSKDLDGGVDIVRDFSLHEDLLRFDVFDPDMTRQQRLARLLLTEEGGDTLLLVHDAQGAVVQAVQLQDVNLLRDENGVTQSSSAALQRLNHAGIVQLSYDTQVFETAPLAPSGIDTDNYRLQTADVLHPHLTGDDKRDALHGNDLNNRLQGEGGADLLRGFAGDDRLDGGSGNDILEGGEGNDTFFWASSALTQGDFDIVRDFSPYEDTLLLNLSSLSAAGVSGSNLQLTTHEEDQWLQLYSADRSVLLQTMAAGRIWR